MRISWEYMLKLVKSPNLNSEGWIERLEQWPLDIKKELNDLGGDGWELVSVDTVSIRGPVIAACVYIFKRPMG